MKTFVALATSLLLVGAVTAPTAARADTAEAECEVRKDGETKQGRSGVCTFSQRQGNIGIELRNGDSWSLTPTGEPNKYRDQKGNKVVRTMQGQDHVYKWPDKNKKITVRFAASGGTSTGGANDLQDIVRGRWVGGEVEDEMARRGYTHLRDDVAGDYVTSFYKGHGKCVVVNFDPDRSVSDISIGFGC
jgi:hypothetical protein